MTDRLQKALKWAKTNLSLSCHYKVLTDRFSYHLKDLSWSRANSMYVPWTFIIIMHGFYRMYHLVRSNTHVGRRGRRVKETWPLHHRITRGLRYRWVLSSHSVFLTLWQVHFCQRWNNRNKDNWNRFRKGKKFKGRQKKFYERRKKHIQFDNKQ